METIGVRELETAVSKILETTPFIDIHTHLFAPGFGKIGLWGIDELLTYHYLEAELFRSASIHPTRYWGLSKIQRADLVWDTLFVRNAPVSEATRGVITVLQALGLRYAVIDDPDQVRLVEDLAAYAYQSAQPAVALLGRNILGI